MEKQFILRTPEIAHNAATFCVDAANAKLLHVVEIKPHKKTRSAEQNAYYWVVMKLIGEHLGYTKDEVHEYFKNKFLSADESVVMGEEVKVYPSTTKLNTAQFNEYIEEISRFMAEQDFVVPPPIAYGYERGGR